ncbi:MAG: hypothetical protein WA639_21590 [Candidatus Acidiferrum sp.]
MAQGEGEAPKQIVRRLSHYHRRETVSGERLRNLNQPRAGVDDGAAGRFSQQQSQRHVVNQLFGFDHYFPGPEPEIPKYEACADQIALQTRLLDYGMSNRENIGDEALSNVLCDRGND